MSTMKSKRRPESGADPEGLEPPREVVDRLAELLAEGALDDAVRGVKPEELSGPGGLLSQLAGRVVEAALEAGMTEHLGHPARGMPNGSNIRNGSTSKTVQSDLGPALYRPRAIRRAAGAACRDRSACGVWIAAAQIARIDLVPVAAGTIEP